MKVDRDDAGEIERIWFTKKEREEIKKRGKLYKKLPKWAKGVGLKEFNIYIAKTFDIYE